MNERPVHIAVSIKDRAIAHIVCSMFSSAGAVVQVCADPGAIEEAPDAAQGIVLGLSAVPEETFDALVLLRQRLATIPIYVVMDAAREQRYAKRAKSFGATQVIAHEQLQRRVGHLVKQVAEASPQEDWSIRSPGWAAARADQGYDIQSMDLGAWLSVPGNRRLLGLEDPPTAPTAAEVAMTPAEREPADAPSDGAPAVAQPTRPSPDAPAQHRPAPAPEQWPPARPAAPAGSNAAPGDDALHRDDANPSPPGAGDRAAGRRSQPGTPSDALLEALRQQEQHLLELNQTYRERLQAELRSELYRAITQQITATEARGQVRIAEGLTEARQQLAAAVRRIQLVVGALAVVAALVGLGLTWRLGVW